MPALRYKEYKSYTVLRVELILVVAQDKAQGVGRAAANSRTRQSQSVDV